MNLQKHQAGLLLPLWGIWETRPCKMLGGWTEAGAEMTTGQGYASPSFHRTYQWWDTCPGPMQIRGQNFHQSEGSSGTSQQVMGGA